MYFTKSPGCWQEEAKKHSWWSQDIMQNWMVRVTIQLRSITWCLALAAALEVNHIFKYPSWIREGSVFTDKPSFLAWGSDFDQNFVVTHRIQLNRVNAQTDKNIASPVVIKLTKHGLVSLVSPNKLLWTDVTIHMDIHRNPRPLNAETTT